MSRYLFLLRSHGGACVEGDRVGPGHGEYNIITIAETLPMPCPYGEWRTRGEVSVSGRERMNEAPPRVYDLHSQRCYNRFAVQGYETEQIATADDYGSEILVQQG